jgi:hypothetical protein
MIYMNKKKIVITLLLFSLIAIVTVFAVSGVTIRKTDTSLTVTRDKGVNGKITGSICIQLDKPGTTWTTEDWWDFEIPARENSAKYNARSGQRIVSYSDTSCIVTPSDY